MSTAKPKPVVIAGPSGVGKGTLIEMLMKKYESEESSPFGFSVSHTTRGARPGETDGVHYHFSSRDIMKEEIDQGKFIEHADVHGNYYGTSVASVKSVQDVGKICILDIDIQGVKQVKDSSLDALYVFISPPSQEKLEKRLRGRGTETEESIQKRLGNAAKEMEFGNADGNFDLVVVNDDLENAFKVLNDNFLKWHPHLKQD